MIKMLGIINFGLASDYIPYYNKTNEAEWHYDNGRFKKAQSLFEDAFKLVNIPKTKDLWLYCIIVSKQDKSKKIFRLLKKHVKAIGGTTTPISPYLEKDGIYLSPRHIRRIDSFVLDTNSVRYREEQRTLNVIKGLYQNDQEIRTKYDDADSLWWGTGNDSVYVSRRVQTSIIDSSNFVVLQNLFRDGKLQNNRFLGYEFATLLLHMTYERFIMIEELLFTMVQNGILDPWDFACAKDRKYTEHGDCIYYFAYTFTSDSLKCRSYGDILAHRKTIGLSIYYSRPSFNFYIKPYRMMKKPLKEFYETELKKKG